MEHLYHILIVLVIMATMAYTTFGVWYVFIAMKNYFYNLGKSLIINDKTYIFESSKDKESDESN